MDKHKISAMSEEKRTALLTAAMAEFAQNGYKKTSTDAIISRAGISKGLLFHYFGTKKDLYIYLYEYANRIVMKEYNDKIDYDSKDIFARLRSMILLKFKLIEAFPAVLDFISSAYFEKDSAVVEVISQDSKKLYQEASGKLLEGIDLSLFKPGIDHKIAIQIILFTIKGYSEAQASSEKKTKDYSSQINHYIHEIDEYITALKAAFYREDRV